MIQRFIFNSIPSHRIDVIYYEPCSGNETGTFCICYLTSWPFSSPYLAYTRKLDRGSRRRRLLSSMAINGWNEIWSHLYWVGRSTNSFPETFTIPFFFFSITSQLHCIFNFSASEEYGILMIRQIILREQK